MKTAFKFSGSQIFTWQRPKTPTDVNRIRWTEEAPLANSVQLPLVIFTDSRVETNRSERTGCSTEQRHTDEFSGFPQARSKKAISKAHEDILSSTCVFFVVFFYVSTAADLQLWITADTKTVRNVYSMASSLSAHWQTERFSNMSPSVWSLSIPTLTVSAHFSVCLSLSCLFRSLHPLLSSNAGF